MGLAQMRHGSASHRDRLVLRRLEKVAVNELPACLDGALFPRIERLGVYMCLVKE